MRSSLVLMMMMFSLNVTAQHKPKDATSDVSKSLCLLTVVKKCELPYANWSVSESELLEKLKTENAVLKPSIKDTTYANTFDSILKTRTITFCDAYCSYSYTFSSGSLFNVRYTFVYNNEAAASASYDRICTEAANCTNKQKTKRSNKREYRSYCGASEIAFTVTISVFSKTNVELCFTKWPHKAEDVETNDDIEVED